MLDISNVDLPWVRTCLQRHRSVDLQDHDAARAAVALILQEGESGPEFLAIQRSERTGDPWSGHVALPGGRMDPHDPNLAFTAMRETYEEVGIDLERRGTHVGKLDDLRATIQGRVLDLVISPHAFVIDGLHQTKPNPREVQSAFWVPVRTILTQHPASDATGGIEITRTEHGFPAFVHNGYAIWGLTYRILTTLIEVLGGGLAENRRSDETRRRIDGGSAIP